MKVFSKRQNVGCLKRRDYRQVFSICRQVGSLKVTVIETMVGIEPGLSLILLHKPFLFKIFLVTK